MKIERPIFIVGFPRSGTTYLQSLLVTQEGLISFPETHFYTVLTGFIQDSDLIQSKLIPEVLKRAGKMLELSFSAEDTDGLIERAGGKGIPRGDLFKWFIDRLSVGQGLDVDSIDEGQILLEKTPSHAWHMEKILHDHPDARFIHITRHPLDSISSHWSKLSQGERPLSDLIKDWTRTHDSVLKFRTAHPDRVKVVRYEDLKKDRISCIRHLLESLELEFDEPRLDGFDKKAEKLIASYETWKSGNTRSDYSEDLREKGLSWKDRAMIQFLLRSRMIKSGYEVREALKQKIYDLKNGGAK